MELYVGLDIHARNTYISIMDKKENLPPHFLLKRKKLNVDRDGLD